MALGVPAQTSSPPTTTTTPSSDYYAPDSSYTINARAQAAQAGQNQDQTNGVQGQLAPYLVPGYNPSLSTGYSPFGANLTNNYLSVPGNAQSGFGITPQQQTTRNTIDQWSPYYQSLLAAQIQPIQAANQQDALKMLAAGQQRNLSQSQLYNQYDTSQAYNTLNQNDNQGALGFNQAQYGFNAQSLAQALANASRQNDLSQQVATNQINFDTTKSGLADFRYNNLANYITGDNAFQRQTYGNTLQNLALQQLVGTQQEQSKAAAQGSVMSQGHANILANLASQYGISSQQAATQLGQGLGQNQYQLGHGQYIHQDMLAELAKNKADALLNRTNDQNQYGATKSAAELSYNSNKAQLDRQNAVYQNLSKQYGLKSTELQHALGSAIQQLGLDYGSTMDQLNAAITSGDAQISALGKAAVQQILNQVSQAGG